MSPMNIQQANEDEARTFFEGLRWPNGPVCPHCASANALRMTGKTVRPGLCRCKDCGKQYSVTVGTIFEGSHIKLDVWLKAIGLMCASKKGISALQISRMMGITYKSAWFMCHRIRHAMSTPATKQMLRGTVEVDETYVGGKRR